MSSGPRILPSGPTAFLAEYDSLDDVMHAAAHLQAERPSGVIDLVPAARTILITVADHGDLTAIIDWVRRPAPVHDRPAHEGPAITIDVVYDGVDLQSVAESCGMTAAEVIASHSGSEYTVACCGFTPGFSYLVGLDTRLHLARRSTPRTRVPAGAVAIAGEFSAVYPTEGPGGWHLLGRTDAVMWDEQRSAAALLPPGARVRFVPR
jgi:KipI family sensor histidine kinase inhibitor